MKQIFLLILLTSMSISAQYEWSEPIQLSDTAQYPDSTYLYPAIAVDNNGVLHAFWVKNIERDDVSFFWYSQIEYRTSLDGGISWSETENLTPEYDDNRIYEIQAVCDSLNNVHLFYLRGVEPGQIWYMRFNGKYWTEPYEITHYATKRIRPVFDRNGRLYLSWNDYLTAYYVYSDLAELPVVWTEPKAINEGVSLETYLSVYNYVFDTSNNLYAIGTTHNGEYYIPVTFQYDSRTDTWHTFDTFEEYTKSSNGVELGISDNDTLYVNILVGSMSTNNNYIQKRHVDDAEWSEPELINTNNTWDYRKLCVDKNCHLHLFEMNYKEGGSRLSYSTNYEADWEIDFYQDDTEHNYAYFNVCFDNNDTFFVVYDKMNLNDNTFKIMLQKNIIETGINNSLNSISNFKLYQNYPNPFNNSTEIKFSLGIGAYVELELYNAKGEIVNIIVKRKFSKGSHAVNFDASNFNSGLYYYRLKIDGIIINTKKMLYLR